MVDLFVLIMMHSILALAAWRLVLRPDLDKDPAAGDGMQAGSVRDA